jgi:hypothetical protein
MFQTNFIDNHQQHHGLSAWPVPVKITTYKVTTVTSSRPSLSL